MSMCPDCGSWNTKTVSTRRDTRYNWVWRRKKCKECDHKFETYELPTTCVSAPDEWANEDGRLKR